jgi:tetratricopeptide (TPR) repeat protein
MFKKKIKYDNTEGISDYWLTKAEQLKKQGKYEEVVKSVDKASMVKESLNKEKYWFSKGQILASIERYEEAIICFDKELQFNKISFDTLYEKGLAFFNLKKYTEAVECFNKAWEIKHEEFMKLNNQGTTLKNYKKFEKAVLYIDQANAITDIKCEFWYYKGCSLYEINKYEEASDCFDKALKMKPDDPVVLFNKAKCQIMLGNTSKSVQLLEKSWELEPKMKVKIQTEKIFEKLIENQKLNKIFF